MVGSLGARRPRPLYLGPGFGLFDSSAHILSFTGFARQAEKRCQTALISAREKSHPFSLACVWACTAMDISALAR